MLSCDTDGTNVKEADSGKFSINLGESKRVGATNYISQLNTLSLNLLQSIVGDLLIRALVFVLLQLMRLTQEYTWRLEEVC